MYSYVYSEPSISPVPHTPNPEFRCFAPLDCHRVFCLTTIPVRAARLMFSRITKIHWENCNAQKPTWFFFRPLNFYRK